MTISWPAFAEYGVRLPLYFAIGFLIGWAHFRALRWNTRLFVNGGSLWRPIVLQILRMTATAAALIVCARSGVSLPAALLGLLLSRQLILRREAST